MGRTQILATHIAELHHRLHEAEKCKQEILDRIGKIKNACLNKEISYAEYEKRLGEKLDSRSLTEWVEYYESYIDLCKRHIANHEKKFKQRNYAVYGTIFISLFLVAFFFNSQITGFLVSQSSDNNYVEYSEQFNHLFSSSSEVEWDRQNDGQLLSLYLSGEIAGEEGSTATVYLDDIPIAEIPLENKDASITRGLTGFIVEGGEDSATADADNSQTQAEESPSHTETPLPVETPTTETEEPQTSTEEQTSTNNSQEQAGQESPSQPQPELPAQTNETLETNETTIPEENITIPQEVNITLKGNISKKFILFCNKECDLSLYNLTSVSHKIRVELNGAEISISDLTYRIANASAEIANETLQLVSQIVINQPVEWNRTITLDGKSDLTISLPKEATGISVNSISESGSDNVDISKKEVKEIQSGDKVIAAHQEIKVDAPVEKVEILYETPAPKVDETIISDNQQEVKVSAPDNLNYTNVLTFTDLKNPLPIEKANTIKLYWIINGSKIEHPFTPLDTDNDSLIDKLEWITPHLSEQTFEIIIITKAEHLDSERNFISDIYDNVKELDENWSETISDGDYVRVTFETPLTNKNDITIYPRVVSGSPTIEVYEVDQNDTVAVFTDLDSNSYNKVLLTNLPDDYSQTVFDLRVVGGSVEFDHIIDPFSSNYTAYNIYTNTTANGLAQPPAFGDAWRGSNGTQNCYTNVTSIDKLICKLFGTGTNSNDDVFLSVNFTINENISNIQAISINVSGNATSSAAGETINFYVANFRNSSWDSIGANTKAMANRSQLITSNFSDYIRSGKLAILFIGADIDTGEFIGVEYANVSVYTNYPKGNITYPQNTTYTSNVSQLNYTSNATESGFCWYSLNNWVTNSSPVTCGTNFTNLLSVEGSNTWLLGMNDSLNPNNKNMTNVTFFKDTIIPSPVAFGARTETNNTVLNQSNIVINVTANDTNLKNINITLYNSSGGIVNTTTTTTSPNYVNITVFSDQNYTFNATVLDTSLNSNNTPTYTVMINGPKPTISIVYPQNTTYYDSPTQVNYTTSGNATNCWYSLNGGTTNSSPVTCGTNFTNVVSNEYSNTIIVFANNSVSRLNSTNLTYHVFPTYPHFIVQQGSVVMTGNSSIIPIRTINASRAFTIITGDSASSLVSTLFAQATLNDTAILLNRNNSGSNLNVRWQVIESDLFFVQRGIINWTAPTNPSLTATLGKAINLNQSFITYTAQTNASGNNHWNIMWRAYFTSDQVVKVDRSVYSLNSGSSVSWEAVQWNGAFTQNGIPTINNNSLSTTSALTTPVNLSQSFIISTAGTDAASSGLVNGNNTAIQAYFLDNSTVEFRRTSPVEKVFLSYFVVSSPDLNVQSGNITYGNSQYNQSISPVSISKAFALASFSTNGTTGTSHAAWVHSYNVTNATILGLNRGVSAGATINGSWFVASVASDILRLQDIINSPANATIVTNPIVSFNATFKSSAGLKNSTLYIWDSSSILINKTKTDITNSLDGTNLTVTLPSAQKYTWNYQVCDLVSTCMFNNTNFSVEYQAAAGNNAPDITRVFAVADQSITENTFKPVVINFSVTDADGHGDLDNSSAKINISRGTEPIRQNNTCIQIQGAGTNANYSCTLNIWYFDLAGEWNISAFIGDSAFANATNLSTNFSILSTSAFVLGPSAITFASITPGSTNTTSNNDPLLLNNTGNAPISTIQFNATHLRGETISDYALWAGNFSVGTQTGSNDECGATGSTLMSYAVFTSLSGATLSRGNNSVNDGSTGQEQLYVCLIRAGSEIASQVYSTVNESSWTVKILVVGFAVRRKRKKKESKDRLIDAVKLLTAELHSKYSVTEKEILEEVIDSLSKGIKRESLPSSIPVSIFSSELGALEAISLYLKDYRQQRLVEIARALSRSEKTIWTSYNEAKKKQVKVEVAENSITIPVVELSSKKLTVFECLISYLKDRKDMKYSDIARLLNRNQRNIWTIYSRTVTKKKNRVL